MRRSASSSAGRSASSRPSSTSAPRWPPTPSEPSPRCGTPPARSTRVSKNPRSRSEFAAAVAATLAPAAAQRCAQDCIQVHGGIGFTWEHDTNVYYRRALGIVAAFGRAADYPQRVVDTATSDRDAQGRHRPGPGHREAARRNPRGSRCAEGDSARRTDRGYRRGRLGVTAPAEAVGTFGESDRADHHPAGVHRRRVRRPTLGIAAWLVPSVVAFGTEEQKQRFLPPTFRGEMIWCQLFSEPGAGSDLAGLTTKATKVDGGWRITGQKIWTTGRAVRSVGHAAGQDGPVRSKTQRHHVLPAGHEQRGCRGAAAARTHRQRDVQHRVHRRRVRARRSGARRGQPRLGGQPHHADRRTGVDRQQRGALPGQPRRARRVRPRWATSTRSRRTGRAG